MFEYYEHFGDNGLVLGRRSHFLAPFQRKIKKRTSNVYLAIAFTGSGPNSFNNNPITEETSQDFYIGLKNYNTINPIEPNQSFLGLFNNSSNSELEVLSNSIDIRFLDQLGLRIGTIYNQNENFNDFNDRIRFSPPDKINTDTECYSILIIKYSISDFELPTQSCVISYSQILEVTDISYSSFKNYIKNYSPDNTGSIIQLNNGTNPYVIPENFYIYWPFVKNRIKLQSILTLGLRE